MLDNPHRYLALKYICRSVAGFNHYWYIIFMTIANLGSKLDIFEWIFYKINSAEQIKDSKFSITNLQQTRNWKEVTRAAEQQRCILKQRNKLPSGIEESKINKHWRSIRRSALIGNSVIRRGNRRVLLDSGRLSSKSWCRADACTGESKAWSNPWLLGVLT